MSPLADRTIAHLQQVVEWPDFSGTRYAILERLGRGGMGSVFRAHDALLDRDVAIKVCTWDTPDEINALLDEARVLARLEHPGIVPVHDAGTLPDGRAFYVMMRVDGDTLAEHVTEVPALTDRVRLFDRICDTVGFAHAHGIVHRDLKPSNIMVGRFGEVRVVDWGLAGRLGADARPAGTEGYMAPEQARGVHDERSDVYALGAVLRDLVQSAAPHGRSRRRALQAIVTRATAGDPAARYASASALASDVRRFVDGERVAAYREPLLERVTRLAAAYKTSLVLVLAYLVMRVLFILWTR